MKIAQIVEIILELQFEIESEEVAKEFVNEFNIYKSNRELIDNNFNLSNAFFWKQTKLGFDFWNELDDKITSYLEGSELESAYLSFF
jgi:hypothetical protein